MYVPTKAQSALKVDIEFANKTPSMHVLQKKYFETYNGVLRLIFVDADCRYITPKQHYSPNSFLFCTCVIFRTELKWLFFLENPRENSSRVTQIN